MIKITEAETFGWIAAIRGMRNPMNSWDKSDSEVSVLAKVNRDGKYDFEAIVPYIGPNDLALMQKLAKAGDDHGKFLRMIHVQADITAPLYWWKEFDTYKISTVANSTSTMHKIHAKEFTLDDFSHEHLDEPDSDFYRQTFDAVLYALNKARELYEETKEKIYWWQMIQLLPSSYNQLRTVDLNYQVLKNMYFARRNHKLDEWHDFCDWCLSLPYFREIVVQEG